MIQLPIEVGIWKLNNGVQKIDYQNIESEEKLENILMQDISILSEKLLVIGRQVPTEYGKYIDILALDENGNTVIIELKKSRTSREVTAQVLDYASWIQNLSYEDVIELYKKMNKDSLEISFDQIFGQSLPDELNETHRMIVVCSELNSETERIINYLADNYDVPINAVFFRYFKDDGNEYLSRSWLIDPTEVIGKVSTDKEKKKEKWNGRDYVVNFDDNKNRSWEDAREFGFVSAGNGRWYSRTLQQLEIGNRIFCMIPKEGYVGIGTVTQTAQPVKEVEIEINGEDKKLLDCNLREKGLGHNKDDMENCEYVVAIEWQKTIPRKKAFWTKGLRANQNTAFKLRNQFTIDHVEKHFENIKL